MCSVRGSADACRPPWSTTRSRWGSARAVEKALKDLRNEGAMSLVARGHQGTYITELDAALLWSAARLSPVHLLLPPNAPPESMRVATAVAERFAPVGAYTTARSPARSRGQVAGDRGPPGGHRPHVRRSRRRPARRRPGRTSHAHPGERYVLRAGKPRRRHPCRRAAARCEWGGATDRHRPGLRRPPAAHPCRVPQGVGRYVPTDFTSVPRAVLLGEIDAGIWHTVDSLIPLDAAGLTTTPLTRPDAVELARAISAAVLWRPRTTSLASCSPAPRATAATSGRIVRHVPDGTPRRGRTPAAPGVNDAGPGALRRGTGAPDQGVPGAGAAESCDRSPRRRDR